MKTFFRMRMKLLTFNFNKHKEAGVTESLCNGKKILEVIV